MLTGMGVQITPERGRYITLYQLPNGTAPNSLLVDSGGNVWVTGSRLHDLFCLDPASGILSTYQIPGENDTAYKMSWSMAEDNEGGIWFAQTSGRPLWRFDPATRAFTSFSSPAGTPFQMKHDPATDETWFTTLTGDSLGLIQKTASSEPPSSMYRISRFPIGNGTTPSGLVLHGGAVWVTEIGTGNVESFVPERAPNGTVVGIKRESSFPQNGTTPFSLPTDILAPKDGMVWVTEHGPSTITRYNLARGNYTRYPTSMNANDVSSLPFWLRESRAGGGMWFNEHEGGAIGFLSDNLTMTEFHLQHIRKSIPLMLNIATDPSDPARAWFTVWSRDEVGYADISVPVPFGITINKKDISLSSAEPDATVRVTLHRYDALPAGTVAFNASSTASADGSLENMTGRFSIPATSVGPGTSPIASTDLSLSDSSLAPGNYTLGVSAGDGLVTKTVFAYVSAR